LARDAIVESESALFRHYGISFMFCLAGPLAYYGMREAEFLAFKTRRYTLRQPARSLPDQLTRCLTSPGSEPLLVSVPLGVITWTAPVMAPGALGP